MKDLRRSTSIHFVLEITLQFTSLLRSLCRQSWYATPFFSTNYALLWYLFLYFLGGGTQQLHHSLCQYAVQTTVQPFALLEQSAISLIVTIIRHSVWVTRIQRWALAATTPTKRRCRSTFSFRCYKNLKERAKHYFEQGYITNCRT